MVPQTAGSAPTSARRVVVASLIGTSLEWYDFFVYGTAAALVFNKLFFPSFEPLVGTLLAFTTYAVGFAARPLGGIIFGHYGDRIGRKNVLVVTLLVMGVATFLIGLLPTYGTIGRWAAVLRVYTRSGLAALGARIGVDVAFYTFVLFIVTYVTQVLKVPRATALNAVLIGAAVQLALIPLFGWPSDRLGRSPVYLSGAVGE